MPSSETPTRPGLTRGWWVGLSAGLALLAGWGLLNVMVDPTGEFGQSGRHGFNRFPPASVIAAGEGGGAPAFFTRAIREHQGDVFLIGSSRTWRGFDTCARPGILRVAGSAWGLREVAQVQQTILKTRQAPATLLIEVGLPIRERPAITDPAQAALSTALSPRTTLNSLRTLGHSRGRADRPPSTYAPCTPLTAGAADWVQADRSLRYSISQMDISPTSLAQGRRNLEQMADQADQMCRRSGLRHTLIFFSLPPMPAGAPEHEARVQANTLRIAAMFAARPRPSEGCDIRYLNMAATPPGTPAEQALWRDRDQWSDYTHFRPRLGAVALEALSRQVDQNQPASFNTGP